ncbi:MAG TPA: hypothetical protein VFP55_00955 [Solirubrobacteraceae bacterium]|nr:hypothetical protein [Solirubrobacteraceae bacterium]
MSTIRRTRQSEEPALLRRNRRLARHDSAIMQAEVRRLCRALAPYGILHHDMLREVADADAWHEGGFEAALSAAVSEGVVEPLPGNFYRNATRPAGQ